MSGISIILVILVAFLAGVEGILDEFEFHQPLVACTLIGIVTGQLGPCLVLGGQLQMIALGWANIGAAVSPDAALASVASAIILVKGGQGVDGVGTAIAVAVPLAVAGLFLTMVVRTLSVAVVHQMDAAAEKGNFSGIEIWQLVLRTGLRICSNRRPYTDRSRCYRCRYGSHLSASHRERRSCCRRCRGYRRSAWRYP